MQVATRLAYGTALAKLGKNNPRVIALDGDTKNSTFADRFKVRPGQSLNLNLKVPITTATEDIERSGPEVEKKFMLNSTEHEISTAHKTKMLKNKYFSCFSNSDVVFIMLINVKMPTIVGILTFMSTINFMLS